METDLLSPAMAAIALMLVVMIISTIYWWLREHFSQFKKLGIVGPKPTLILGNLSEIVNKGQLQAMIDWGKQYGRIYGFYEGYTPVMVVSDPDILKEVLVKDFHNYQRRKPFPLASKKARGLFLEDGARWKNSRSILTPGFSSAKIRQMSPIIRECVDRLIDNIDAKYDTGKPFDIYGLYQRLTLDVIGQCAFGLHTNAQTDENDPFLVEIRFLFDTLSRSFILPFAMVFPFIRHFINGLKRFLLLGYDPVTWLKRQLREVINIRKAMVPDPNCTDLIHILMASEGVPLQKNPFAHEHASDRPEKVTPLTEDDIIAQCITFILAGYETTSTVLAYISHVLIHHPEVQEKLYQELLEKVQDKEDIAYDEVQRLTYMDMVINEVFRLYPTASHIVTRLSKHERVYGDVIIPAGMAVQANVWSIHHDPEYWEDPEKFDPERFSPENKPNIKPYSFLPFGAGPRYCIGERFARMESKIALAKLLRKYIITKCAETKSQLEFISRGAIVPRHGINVNLVRRR